MGAGSLGYATTRVQGRAAGDVDAFLAASRREKGRPADARPVTVCLGASIVRGRASVDFVRMLRERFPDRVFVNAGVNGDVVFEAWERLDAVLECRPSKVLVLVGTNDVRATLSATVARAMRRSKGLPGTPSLNSYREYLSRIVVRLEDSGVDSGLCSLPPLGQDLASVANRRVREFNAVIRDVAEREDAAYLAVYERLASALEAAAATSGPAFNGEWRPCLESLVRHFVLRESYDAIARRRGLLLSPDLIHLNTLAAQVIADTAAEFVET